MSETPASSDADFRAYWLEHAELRVRRELVWLWRRQAPVDWVAEALQRRTNAADRETFFREDATASYLTKKLEAQEPVPEVERPRRGSFAWVAARLKLTAGETFATALALLAGGEASAGALFAAAQGEARQRAPTLGLAHWLWDRPAELLPLTRAAHPLYRLAILRRGERAVSDEWSHELVMPATVVETFLTDGVSLPEYLVRAATGETGDASGSGEMDLLARRMEGEPDALRIVPVSLPYSGGCLTISAAAPALRRLAAHTGREILAPRPGVRLNAAALSAMGTMCWLAGCDLALPSKDLPPADEWQVALAAAPIYVFAAAPEGDASHSADERTLPVLRAPALTPPQTLATWRTGLSRHGVEVEASDLAVVARRFRFGEDAIERVAASLSGSSAARIDRGRLILGCEQEIGLQIGANARLVTPRFQRSELVLDAERARQFDELSCAMEHVGEVHENWGTGRVWSQAGVSALFAGAPGTGKTMAAEVLAAELRLPMYRVDISQVVNKFIGETEKNLARLFDACEQADVLMLFDDAESLFASRMTAKTSNDRFANTEVSYLLGRMENFRGLAILTTNRKKDLDEAFLRRLRFAIEFPLPGEAERLAIWRRAIPEEVAVDDVDFKSLAREFALAGGHIRSIVLNACLQAAGASATPRLTMDNLRRAAAREFEKLGRPLGGGTRSLSTLREAI